MTDIKKAFNVDERRVQPKNALIVDLDGYEGPLDVLLDLAREQKVDLLKISVLDLTAQYLRFIEQLHAERLEIAADYLVMAAWLVYLKSRLLLPDDAEDDGPTGAELSERLAFQLKKLEAMGKASKMLMDRPVTGRDRVLRGMAEGLTLVKKSKFDCNLVDLLKAYGGIEERKGNNNPLRLMREAVFSVEAAQSRLEEMLGAMPEWADLMSYLPDKFREPFTQRSAKASTFLASLQMVKEGRLEIRQSKSFGPIKIRPIKERRD
ncbi:MAG: ScpA family protein [Sneathiella sp.]